VDPVRIGSEVDRAPIIARVNNLADCGEHPEQAVLLSQTILYNAPRDEVESFQLQAIKTRFRQLGSSIPFVARLAEEQNISDVSDISDIAGLLLRHSDYKSYPVSFLEKRQYSRLTRWLNGLTPLDLTNIDVSACESLDDWVAVLDEYTEIRLVSSSGTTGKLSFLPRTETDGPILARASERVAEGFGAETDEAVTSWDDIVTMIPSMRPVPLNLYRVAESFRKYLYGGDAAMVILPNPTRQSLEALSLTGRLQAAQASGERGTSTLSPLVEHYRAILEQQQREMPAVLDRFMTTVLPNLSGRRVRIQGIIGSLFDLAVEGEARGLHHMFASNSILQIGGGAKGRTLPPGYLETIARFTGVEDEIRPIFGMSELMEQTRRCHYGRFHVYPFWVLFVLDGETGVPLPRSGEVKGRLGLFDLGAVNYWGGFLTGDEVTVDWGDAQPCPCGRKGPFIHDSIRRFSDKDGGDDKITCAGAPAAHDKALAVLFSAD
jgi:hypothetical protein